MPPAELLLKATEVATVWQSAIADGVFRESYLQFITLFVCSINIYFDFADKAKAFQITLYSRSPNYAGSSLAESVERLSTIGRWTNEFTFLGEATSTSKKIAVYLSHF